MSKQNSVLKKRNERLVFAVSLLGVGTVPRLERDTRSMVKLLRNKTNEYPPPLPPGAPHQRYQPKPLTVHQ